jgi:type I restriction enzyme S subunit
MAVLEQWPLPIIPLSIQRKISAILTAYDDLIETNKRRIALLEQMAEEIYREWFVRMRFPGHRDTKFLKGVPEGWEVRAILATARS